MSDSSPKIGTEIYSHKGDLLGSIKEVRFPSMFEGIGWHRCILETPEKRLVWIYCSDLYKKLDDKLVINTEKVELKPYTKY